jgi:hypothetical protein
LLVELLCTGRRPARALAALLLLLFALKLALEAASGEALAAGPLPAGVTVAPAAHAAGALAGGAAAALAALGRARSAAAPKETPDDR